MKPMPYDYSTVLASFFDAAGDLPEHTNHLKPLIEATARHALSNPDVPFMPAFKVLDMLSGLVNLCVSIAREPHLRPNESRAMLSQLISDDAPLLTHFYREAALERVRYEPVMLTEHFNSAWLKRNAILQIRLSRMCDIYLSAALLTPEKHNIVTQHAQSALQSNDFSTFRAGPMCQLFAEMLSATVNTSSTEEIASLIGPTSKMWRRFRLKSHRFSADVSDPLITGASPNRIESPIPVTHHLH